MFTRELLRDLLRHMEWADARVWSLVLRRDVNDQRLLRLLVHTHVVQYAFLTAWRRGDVTALLTHSETLTQLTDVETWARAYYPQVHAFLDAASEQHLAQPLQVPWSSQVADYLGRAPGATTLGETVFQVTSHSTYHRGQTNAQLRTLGHEPPNVDYIAWLWLDRPAAQWGSS